MGDASRMALKALGPQEEYLLNNSTFDLGFRQYTDFSIDHVSIPFGINPYPNTKQQIEIDPRSFKGDLISNMHLYVKLKKLDNQKTYADNIGRAIIKSYSLYVNETEIETITSDWLVIRDQVFLDDDEKAGISNVINGGYSFDSDSFKTNYSRDPTDVQLTIPLEFFFCRRHSPYRKERDRVSRPFFPICAIKKQKVYIVIEFYNSTFYTDAGEGIDFADQCRVVIETITLTPEERIKYNDNFNLIINKVYKETKTELSASTGEFNITANFPIAASFWFFRKKIYESDTIDVFDSHYEFGYTYTNDISYNFIDPFEYISLYLNNKEVTPKIDGKNFFKYLQPINYNLSTPVKEIYMYCYGITPKEYNTGGTYDFSQVSSKSVFIKFKLNTDVVTDILQNYTFNMYHYGYNVIRFSDGYVRLAFL